MIKVFVSRCVRHWIGLKGSLDMEDRTFWAWFGVDVEVDTSKLDKGVHCVPTCTANGNNFRANNPEFEGIMQRQNQLLHVDAKSGKLVMDDNASRDQIEREIHNVAADRTNVVNVQSKGHERITKPGAGAIFSSVYNRFKKDIPVKDAVDPVSVTRDAWRGKVLDSVAAQHSPKPWDSAGKTKLGTRSSYRVFCTLLSLQTEYSGHAVALACGPGGKVCFFDPNYGGMYYDSVDELSERGSLFSGMLAIWVENTHTVKKTGFHFGPDEEEVDDPLTRVDLHHFLKTMSDEHARRQDPLTVAPQLIMDRPL